jgi:peptidoglycan-N-acetylmuramic acid deacetylase
LRKFLPLLLVLSLGLNIYLLGTNFFNVSPAAGDVTEEESARLEQLQNQIQEYEEKTAQLERERQELQDRLESMQSAAEPISTADNKVYSWYFKRSTKNIPPTTEPQYMQMLKDKGYFLGDTNKKKIYLTFDEGYENGYTAQILDTLKANNVPAAFFVTGSYVEKNPDLVKRMAAEGHIIGNHSDTHPSMPTISNEQIKKELDTVEKQVGQLTGQEMHYFRPPRGEFNQRVLDVAAQEGYKTIFWSMAYRDWVVDEQPGKDAAFNFVTNNIHNGAIILLHAVSKSNTEALDSIIKELKDRGYTFAGLNQLP